MKNQPNSKKTIIYIVVIAAIALLAFFYFSGDDAPEGALLESQATPEADVISSRVLNLLNQIRSLRIDTALFSATAYQTLIDYSVPIPQVNVGRANPFAPLPGVPASADE